MELSEIKPQASSFKLAITGKTYRLRPMTLDDQIWIQQTFGNEVENIFKEMRMAEICRIVYRLLVDRSDFKKQKVMIQNEDGDEAHELIGGVKLLRACISGQQEFIEVFRALMDTIGVSKPIRKKLGVGEVFDEKKSPLKKSRGKK